jgi:Flp pilus assembly protein TadB
MTVLVYLIGIATFALIVLLTVEFVPSSTAGRLADTLTPGQVELTGWRRSLAILDKPVSQWTPMRFLQKAKADLYWARLVGKWTAWNEVQFLSLRLAAAVGGFVIGSLVFHAVPVALVAAFIAFQYPSMSVNGVARRTRRQFQAQLPEFIQLVSAQMSAGVSMEEALNRTAQAQSLVGKWMRYVIQMAQGRGLIEQMQREAQESLMPELIGMAVQLDFIRKGTAQQQLMGQLAMSIAADYIGGAEQRAEKVGSELVIPMVIFYFLPFMVTLLAVIGWPIFTNMGR